VRTDLGQLNGNSDPPNDPVDVDKFTGTNLPGGRTGPYRNIGPQGRFKDNALNMPCQQPRWGELVAVNVNTGDIAWKVPLGVTDNLPADKQKTGRPNIGGSIATAGGVVFIGATDDSRFRAFDAKRSEGKKQRTIRIPLLKEGWPRRYRRGRGGPLSVLRNRRRELRNNDASGSRFKGIRLRGPCRKRL
jgi:quinoprotein glucose dehydrogenase